MVRLIVFALFLWGSMGCTKTENTSSSQNSGSENSTSLEAPTPSQRKTLVFIGDSLTEGYGVPKDFSFPSLVQQKLESKGLSYEVVNSGVSGSTSASAPSRVKWALKSKPEYIVLALGANDGLRGLSTSQMKKNLSEAIELAQAKKVKVLLLGMYMPPSLGSKYTKDFAKVFSEITKKYKVPLLPFLLEDVGGVQKYNQADGIHPNEEGHQKIAQNVFRFLEENLK
tara:strand:+ start:2570 stop:3247 length:678 start_codon:yes stop_codon:yes gene_type:complete